MCEGKTIGMEASLVSLPSPAKRTCFTRGCNGIPTGNNWECDDCRQRIHEASVAATERKQRAATLAAAVGIKIRFAAIRTGF